MLEPPRSSQLPQITLTGAGDIYAQNTAENRELARRVRACVNACAGFTTDDLEHGILDQMRQVIEQLAPLAAAKTAGRAA